MEDIWKFALALVGECDVQCPGFYSSIVPIGDQSQSLQEEE